MRGDPAGPRCSLPDADKEDGRQEAYDDLDIWRCTPTESQQVADKTAATLRRHAVSCLVHLSKLLRRSFDHVDHAVVNLLISIQINFGRSILQVERHDRVEYLVQLSALAGLAHIHL